ncbi:MAG TPA: hypothetical protein DCL21_03015 [Alphaproteobacteria bacterium]|nr:hypothetical protein [Alphaproteobacteria bacterium]
MNTTKLVILSLDDVLINPKNFLASIWTESLEKDFNLKISQNHFSSKYFHLNALDTIRELSQAYGIKIPESYIMKAINPDLQKLFYDKMELLEYSILCSSNLTTGSYKIAVYTKLQSTVAKKVLKKLELTDNIFYRHKTSPKGLDNNDLKKICEQTSTHIQDATLIASNLSDIKKANRFGIYCFGALELHKDNQHVINTINKTADKIIESNITLRPELACHFR